MLSVYETAVNIRWFVVKPRSHFENKMASKGLSFDEFKKFIENVLFLYSLCLVTADSLESTKVA